VVTLPESFIKVKEKFIDAHIPIVSEEITMIPKTSVKVEGAHAEQVVKLLEALEELDDVQQVYSNFDIDEKELKE